MSAHAACVLVCTVSGLASCGAANDSSRPDSEAPLIRQWQLPDELREISGLALTADNRLLAVNDEVAFVYEIDAIAGKLVKRFAFGDPVLRGDFEGIAMTGTTVWLMTSDGRLYSAPEGGDGERVTYEQFRTKAGKYCELEGLASNAQQDALLLACKEAADRDDPPRIFEIEIANGIPAAMTAQDLPVADLAAMIGRSRLRPSAIDVDPESRNRILLASNQLALLTVSHDGVAIDAIILPGKGRHRQPEGIAISADGRLMVADEGGDGRARLAVYRWTSGRLGPEKTGHE